MDVSENELEIWYGSQDRFAITLRAPDGRTFGPIEPGEFLENEQLEDGSFVSIYSELYHPANGANYIAVYLSPYFGGDRVAGVARGTWQVRLAGLDVRDGRFHAWIERDDLMRIRDFEFRFPSFLGARSNVDDTSVSSLACGQDTVAVANLDEVLERINVTSSQGPTRDGRPKPDVAAPGTAIVAANGFSGPEDPWISMTGTSMASPYVAGVVGLMLSVEPSLTAAQVEGIIARTARPLPAHDYAWVNDAGFGRIDPRACIEEASRVNARTRWSGR
jgi:subtilisin family serine protease